jgi:cytochrome c peroxidase
MRLELSRFRRRKRLASGLALVMLAGVAGSAAAQPADVDSSATLAGEIAHKQRMRQLFPDRTTSTQNTPQVIPQLEVDADPSGTVATFQPGGSTVTASNPFFQNLGSNGRTCFTCHQPQDGWALSAQHAKDRFAADSNEPLFRLVDGATCPSADVSTPVAKAKAYSLLTDRGLIRVGLPMLSTMQFKITGVQDPYSCNANPATGLSDQKTGIASFYRRPLPSTNLGFLSTIMWDGREPDLFHQSVDATLGHAQGSTAPSVAQQNQIVGFEGCAAANNPGPCAAIPPGGGLFTAQLGDAVAGSLDRQGATGGPVNLAQHLSDFFIGINDPLGFNPTGAPFSPVIFTEFDAWSNLAGASKAVGARQAIARGEQVFNSVPITITGVGGLNDALGQPSISGFCGTCHDTPHSGNHSVKAPLNIGVANAGEESPPVLNLSGLPVFTVSCTDGPLKHMR